MTVVILISGALLNLKVTELSSLAKGLLTAGHVIAVLCSIFMVFNTGRHLDRRRDELQRIYAKWPQVSKIRGGRDNDVTSKDAGDWFFIVVGVVGPLFAALLILVFFYCPAARPGT